MVSHDGVMLVGFALESGKWSMLVGFALQKTSW